MALDERPPEWKYQRQFDYSDGISTGARRPDLLAPTQTVPLTDDQVRRFVANGHLTLQPTLPRAFHDDMFARFVELIGDDNDDNPGNNLLPLVPELQLLYDDPVIKGALASVLGDDFMMHPHRVLHDNPPGSDAQVWHHDSYWGYKRKVHNHHPWWVMLMYYPQDIYEEIGPTGMIPGSQYIAQRLTDIDQHGVHGEGPAGTVVMIHYDIWHRKMQNFTALKRFMVKFEFMRMTRPQGVTWEGAGTDWTTPDAVPGFDMAPVWAATWRWLGRRDGPERAAEGVDALVAALGDDSEVVGLNAAYRLAEMGDTGRQALLDALTGDDGENVDDARCFIDEGQKSELEMVARNAAHGLVATGVAAVPALLDAARDGGPRVRKYACFALGELDTDDAAVVDALIAGCRDDDAAVRLNAVEALGLKAGSDAAAQALAAALDDEDDEVRFNAALALARLGPAAAPATPALIAALSDGNRYVAGYAVEALQRIGTADANAALVRFLMISRWCPLTSNKDLF